MTLYPLHITVDYKEELTEAVAAHIDDPVEQEIKLCFDMTEVCSGVDREQFRINKYKGPVSGVDRNQNKIHKVLGFLHMPDD